MLRKPFPLKFLDGTLLHCHKSKHEWVLLLCYDTQLLNSRAGVGRANLDRLKRPPSRALEWPPLLKGGDCLRTCEWDGGMPKKTKL